MLGRFYDDAGVDENMETYRCLVASFLASVAVEVSHPSI